MGSLSGQTWQAEGYHRNAGFVADLGDPVVDLLSPREGEQILDLGCGDGRLSAEISARGALVMGADSSADLLAAARGRGLMALEVDGEELTFLDTFDAVFSNAALHWMIHPDAVIAGVHRSLKSGGRFVGEFGGHGNVAAVVTALLAVLARRGIDGWARFPWYFPTAEEYASRLAAGGFEVRSIELIPRPTPLPTGMIGWLETFSGPFFRDFSQNDRSVALSEAIMLLQPSLCDDQGRWTADYVRLRFDARKV
ncbi:class I SAM-dependent methyltransferase [Telmatospirillum siberiense]|uniref:SAM-dependent methyltransferase n=1 Tax=Telmatospirillum siberiense TaxID=382514 RepID=A0A2N3PRW6_9PROT|nr:class I SAM-dependent methyltransferase [Telmatospirillum siberiense]PKU23149.1 SAM-dependent methyltransferase [Telmatospirillum siberiense]